MAVDHQKLADEYRLDPRGYGYAADLAGGNDNGLMDRINVKRDGTNVPARPTADSGFANGIILVNRGFIRAEELVNAIVFAEYTGGQAAQRQYIDMLMSLPQIDLSPNSNPRAALLAIFPAGSQTRTNITNLVQEIAGRARELFGQNVNLDDVSRARNLLST